MLSSKNIVTAIMVACMGLFAVGVIGKASANPVSIVQISTIVKPMEKLGFYCSLCDKRIARDVGKLKNVIRARVERGIFGSYQLAIQVKGPVDMKAIKRIIERENYRFI